jgi:hypothetical protein
MQRRPHHHDKFTDNGFLFEFIKNSANGLTRSWRCDKYRNEKCRAQLHTNLQNEVIKRQHQHSHDSNLGRCIAHNIRKAIKRRAVDTLEPQMNIINQELHVVNIAVLGQIAKKDTLRKMVQCARKGKNIVPAASRDLIELDIPDKYQSYQPAGGADERFLLIDTSPALDCILIFGREHDRT